MGYILSRILLVRMRSFHLLILLATWVYKHYFLFFPPGIPVARKANKYLIGKFVAAALKNRSEALDVQVLAAADYYTPTRILAEFEEVTGKKTRFIQVDAETYKSFLPGPMAEEMLENHLFIESPGYYAGQSLKESHNLLEKAGFKPTSWKTFLETNKTSF